MRSKAKRELQSMPDDFDIAGAGDTLTGSYGSIQVYNPDFPDDATSVVVNGAGKNLSGLNEVLTNGSFIYGHFSSIEMPAVSDMVIIGYKL